jgi:formylglycine-generating enzyme required for sulfatase activity
MCACAGSKTCLTPPRSDAGPDQEICIPAGDFLMGHAPLPAVPPPDAGGCTTEPQNDWTPVHAVHLNSFYIDAFEVTWGRYRSCVSAGFCSTDAIASRPTGLSSLTSPSMAQQPIDGLRWNDALTFCLWSGKRLATEAEWERAARGPSDSDYPWGEPPPPETGPTKVPGDVSPEGVHDMFGGVAEWVGDWYDPLYYANAAPAWPLGPPAAVRRSIHNPAGGCFPWITAGEERVVRGLRFNPLNGDPWFGKSPAWFRYHDRPESQGYGVRCARDDRAPGDPPAGGAWVYQGLTWRSFPQMKPGQGSQ